MKANRKTRRKKTEAWYKAEIKRLDNLINKIRAKRFGYKAEGGNHGPHRPARSKHA